MIPKIGGLLQIDREKLDRAINEMEVLVDRILEEAKEEAIKGRRSLSEDAVNWAGLCSSVSITVNYTGYCEWLICIDEAAPDASSLHGFVADKLKAAGVEDDFDIRTEW